jgi:hypothetical protein
MLQRVFFSTALFQKCLAWGFFELQCDGVQIKLSDEMDHLFLLMLMSFSKAVAIQLATEHFLLINCINL